MDILLLKPTLKETIWGGSRLVAEYGFQTDLGNVAEAWVLSCHKDGPSYVLNGANAGKTLAEALALENTCVLGTHNEGRKDFPILIKFIDAKEKLSVQVHPGDEYARRVENENGTADAWLILDSASGAQLVYGVNKELTREEFRECVKKNEIGAVLNHVPVKKGDVVFIPSGMLHAIGGGILLAEVQQSSNTTYRVYDYNRPGKDGKPRELHVEKAADVVELTVPSGGFEPAGVPETRGDCVSTYLTGCDYFRMTRLSLNGTYTDTADETSFVSLLVLEGSGTLSCATQLMYLNKGDSVFIPANKGAYSLRGKMEILETRT